MPENTILELINANLTNPLGFIFFCLLLRPPLLRLLHEESLNRYKLSLIPLFFAVLFLFLMIPGRLCHDQDLKIIATFAKQHNATLDYAVRDGRFSLRLLF